VTVYNDVETMFRDMVGFIRTMSLAAEDILPADDPRNSLLGFCWAEDSSVRWEIPLSLLVTGLQTTFTTRMLSPEQLRSMFQAAPARVGMIEFFVGQASQHVMSREQAEERGIHNLIERTFNPPPPNDHFDEEVADLSKRIDTLNVEPNELPPRTVWEMLEDDK